MQSWIRIAIAGSATLMVGMGIGRFSYTPLVPALIGEGSVTSFEAGYVGAGNLAGYLIGALLALILGRSFGETRTLKVSLWISLACLVGSIFDFGFIWLACWRFLIGVTVAVMMILTLSIVTRSAPGNFLGRATGIVFTGVGVGILFSGFFIPILLRAGVFEAWIGMALVGLAGVILGHWGWNAVSLEPKEKKLEEQGVEKKPGLTTPIIGLIASQTMFSIGLIPHTIFWVDYLVRGLGHNINFGGFHWVLFGIGAISGTYLWGRFADLVGFRAALVLVFSLLSIGILIPVTIIEAWALIFSSLVVGAQPGFSAIISGRTHQIVGAALMPVVWRWMMLTSGILQAIGGYVYVFVFDYTGDYVLVFCIGGTAMALGAVVSFAFISKGKKYN